MAKIKIDLGSWAFELNFTVKDFYMTTPLGCHAGGLGNFGGYLEYKTAQGAIGSPAPQEIYRSKGLYRKLMDELVKGAEIGFEEISPYGKKGHWILSGPWGNPAIDPNGIGTAEIMDLISQFCDREPEKYGHYVMTNPSDCAAHGNNSGFPATRTMVWMPAYVGFSQNSQGRTSRATGVWTPFVPEPKVPKAVEKPKVIEPPKVEIKGRQADIVIHDDVVDAGRFNAYRQLYGMVEEQPADIKRRLVFRIEKNRLHPNELAKRRDEQTRKADRMYPGRYQGRIDMHALRRRHGGGWEQRYGNRAR